MNKFSQLPFLDKIAAVLAFTSLAFWSFSKLPQITNSAIFATVYDAIWLYMIVVTLLTTFYFLYKWIDFNLKFKTIYCYGFIIGVLTLVIMRFL